MNAADWLLAVLIAGGLLELGAIAGIALAWWLFRITRRNPAAQ